MVDPYTVVLGEIGLGGEIRAVSFAERRMREAIKLGFENMIIPKSNTKDLAGMKEAAILGVRRLEEVFENLLKK